MIRHIATIGLLLVTGSVAEAGWEIAFLGGWTAPTFEETFTYQLDLGLPSFPGSSLSWMWRPMNVAVTGWSR